MGGYSTGARESFERSDAIRRFALFANNHARSTPLLCASNGKVSFRTSTAAEKYIQAGVKMGRVDGQTLSPYKCPDCPYFHTTSASPTVKPAPEAITARLCLRQEIRLLRGHMWRKDLTPSALDRYTTSVIELDRWVRTAEFCGRAKSIEDVRASARDAFADRLLSSSEDVRRNAQRMVDELVPLGLDEESWGWTLDARNSLMDEFDKATGEDDPTGITLAMTRYLAILDSHISAHGLNKAEVYRSEFVLMSDATEDWVEFSPYEDSTAAMMDALLDMEIAGL